MSNFSRRQTSDIDALRQTIDSLSTRLDENEILIKRLRKAQQKSEQRINVIIDLVGELMVEPETNKSPLFSTSQEKVWRTDHGFRYVVHHIPEVWEKTRIPLWQMFLDRLHGAQTACEFGCNIGANLKAIHQLDPQIKLTGIEINPYAVQYLRKAKIADIYCDSILSVNLERKFDLVFTRGVLIHIPPDELHRVMHNMAAHSAKYVLIMEHYSKESRELESYRPLSKVAQANEGYQFWRDFSGEFQKLYPSWRIHAQGCGLDVDKKPEEGSLHWTISERPVSAPNGS